MTRPQQSELIRPRVGQVWAFGSPDGRKVTITRICRGICGKWGLDEKRRLVPLGPKPHWCYWVHATQPFMPQSVRSFLKNFYPVK